MEIQQWRDKERGGLITALPICMMAEEVWLAQNHDFAVEQQMLCLNLAKGAHGCKSEREGPTDHDRGGQWR